jgi:hypothetical protein
MSKDAFRIRRNPLGSAVVLLMVMFAPSPLAQTASAEESTQGPVINLMSPGSFSGSFETACLDSVEALSATVNVIDRAASQRAVGGGCASQRREDGTASGQRDQAVAAGFGVSS